MAADPRRNVAYLTAAGRAKGCRASAVAIRARARKAYAELAPLILGLVAEGRTQRQIAEWLNANGRPTRTGKPWRQRQVKRVIDRARGGESQG